MHTRCGPKRVRPRAECGGGDGQADSVLVDQTPVELSAVVLIDDELHLYLLAVVRWTWAAVASSSGSGASGTSPPVISRSVVSGTSSPPHLVPQRQHAASWRAMGAWHERHKRGICRSRITARSCVWC